VWIVDQTDSNAEPLVVMVVIGEAQTSGWAQYKAKNNQLDGCESLLPMYKAVTQPQPNKGHHIYPA